MRKTTMAAALLLLAHSDASLAIDSYRYLHVSIETPWMIFLFLLVLIFIPFILMVVLMWRQMQRNAAATKPTPSSPPKDPPA